MYKRQGPGDHYDHDCHDSRGNIGNRRNKTWYFVGDPGDVYKRQELELPVLLAAWLSFSMSEIRGLTKSKSISGDHIRIAEVVVVVGGKDPVSYTHLVTLSAVKVTGVCSLTRWDFITGVS